MIKEASEPHKELARKPWLGMGVQREHGRYTAPSFQLFINTKNVKKNQQKFCFRKIHLYRELEHGQAPLRIL